MNEKRIYTYRAYGQFIRSDLKLPEFTEVTIPQDSSAIRIRQVALPKTDPSLRNAGMYRVQNGVIDLDVPEIVRIRVASRDEIQIDIPSPEREREARLYLTGSGFGALSYLQSRVPFHCGLVVEESCGFAITGPSGIGKSTLTTAFVQDGFGFMSDDVVLLDDREDGVFITPSFPRIKLWQDAIDQFDIRADDLDPLHYAEDKFHIPFEEGKIIQHARLSGVFLLKYCDQGSDLKRVNKHRALEILRENIYRLALIEPLHLEAQVFKLLSKIAATIPIYEVSRPQDLSLLPETLATLKAEMSNIRREFIE